MRPTTKWYLASATVGVLVSTELVGQWVAFGIMRLLPESLIGGGILAARGPWVLMILVASVTLGYFGPSPTRRWALTIAAMQPITQLLLFPFAAGAGAFSDVGGALAWIPMVALFSFLAFGVAAVTAIVGTAIGDRLSARKVSGTLVG